MFGRYEVLRNFSLSLITAIISGVFLSLFCVSNLCANPPIKIGLTLGLTGKYSEMSQMQRRGYELWVSEVNKKGGLLGRGVKLMIYDDRSDPVVAQRIYENMLQKGDVDLIFSPYSSEITEAVAHIVERHGYPMIAAGAAADRIWQRGNRYIFGLFTPASRYTLGFLQLLVMNNIDDLSILYADDSFSVDVGEGAKKWAERLKLKVRYVKKFKKASPDFEPILKEARNSGARVLIVCGHFDESIKVRKLLRQIGWNPIYFATVGPVTERFYKEIESDAELTFSSSPWGYNSRDPKNREFYKSFLKTYGIKPTYHAADAYAAGQLIEQAITRVGTTKREQLKKVLSLTEAITILGRYKVDKMGMQKGHQNLIIQWQNGKKEIVWPESLRTAKPIWK